MLLFFRWGLDEHGQRTNAGGVARRRQYHGATGARARLFVLPGPSHRAEMWRARRLLRYWWSTTTSWSARSSRRCSTRN